MKSKFEKFFCPPFGELRCININGIYFDCSNEKTLLTLAKQRIRQKKLNNSYQTLTIENHS